MSLDEKKPNCNRPDRRTSPSGFGLLTPSVIRPLTSPSSSLFWTLGGGGGGHGHFLPGTDVPVLFLNKGRVRVEDQGRHGSVIQSVILFESVF